MTTRQGQTKKYGEHTAQFNMKNVSAFLILLWLSVSQSFGATVIVYADESTKEVISPVGVSFLSDSVGLDYLLFGDGDGGWTQKKEGDAQDALGIRGSNDGGQVGRSSSTTYGGAVGFNSDSTFGGSVGLIATTESGASVGQYTISTDGFALGYEAVADGPGRGQLGTGTNSVDYTIQFRDSGSITAAEFGRLAVQTRLMTSSGFALISDHVIFANKSIGMKVSLLSAATVGDGYILDVKNIGTGPVTVDSTGAETIDGELSIILTTQYESVTLVSDGSNWFIL